MSWSTVALGDVFEIARGGSPRPIEKFLTDSADGLNWVSISDATRSGKVIERTERRIKPEGLSKSRWVEPGDFLLSNSMSFGRPYIMGTTGCIHDGWLVLKPGKTRVDPDYLYHLLGSEPVYAQFAKRATGTTVKNLNTQIVSETEIPLPSLPEQRRIASILDQADALRRLRRQSLSKLDDLLSSKMAHIIQSERSSMSPMPLSDYFENIRIGPFGSLLHKSDYVEGGVPLINPMHIRAGRIIANPAYSVNENKAAELARYRLMTGEIIMGRRGEMGRAANVRPEHEGYLCGTGSMVLRINQKFADAEFMTDFLASPVVVSELERAAGGVTMANLNTSSLAKIFLPVPALDAQYKYLKLKLVVDRKGDPAKKSLSSFDILFASLQHRAFRGEL